jgi:uncharacterized membrane protein
MIQRGPIILIVGEALFIVGIIIAVVWAIQLASTFASTFQQDRNTLINSVSIEPGSSVEAATTQVTDVSRPITVAIHIQRLGGREEAAEGEGLQQRLQQQLQLPRDQREARLNETVTDPSGTVVSSNEFSANLFTTFQPQNTGNYILNITNAAAKNATIYGIFGYMPLLTGASSLVEGGQLSLPGLDLSTFSGVIVGGVLTALGFITIIAGTIIVVIDSRKRGEQKRGGSSSDSVGEGGITYRKD